MKLINPDRKHTENDILDNDIPDRSVEKPKFTPSYQEIVKNHTQKKKHP